MRNSFLLRRFLLAGATMCAGLGAARAATPQDTLTPELVAELRAVSSAAISPDGGQVAFVLGVPRTPGEDDDGPTRTQLHVANVADGSVRAFVTSPEGVRSVAWTRDGTGISFLAKRSGDEFTKLYVIPRDGGEAQVAAELSDRSIGGYAYSHDGAQLALRALQPKGKERKAQEKQGFKQEIYEENLPLYEAWIDAPFSDDEPRRLELEGHVYATTWSPDGTKLAVSIAPTALVDDQYMAQRVWIVDAETGSIGTKIENPGKLGPVTWSPDGSELALIAAADIHDGSAARLLMASVKSGALRNRLLGYGGDVHQLVWRDEGMLLRGSKGVRSVLEFLGPDGPPRVVIGPEGPALDSVSLAQDARTVACVGSTPEHPPEVFVGSLEDGSLRRLTFSNPSLDGVRLAKQEVITYAARDGLEIEGLLIRPLDEQPGTQYPLILVVHGGPESHYSNEWLTNYSMPGQMAAARGFAVFYPNYRGSTGRGLDYIKSSLGDPAGKEFDDLVDGVDHLVAMGLVDTKRVGVTGGSYGGYATGWCSTRYSERFAAGVMFVGISNKISKVGTTDIPNEEFCVHALKRPWEDWNFFLERSPIFYAGQSKTPLLILHGKDDPRVDPGQSKELYRHLKLRSKAPVRLVLYPGEGHGNRKAAARYDYSLRSLRWFEHYLQGEGGEAPSPTLDYAELKADDAETAAAGAGS